MSAEPEDCGAEELRMSRQLLRPYFRWSLRSFGLLFLLVAIGFAFVGQRLRENIENNQIAFDLSQSDAKVFLDDAYELEDGGIQIRKKPKSQVAGKATLVDRFLPRVASPLQVVFDESTPDPSILGRLNKVPVINIHDGCILRAPHIEHLGECTKLRRLLVSNQSVIDGDAWRPILQLRNLKFLSITNCDFNPQLLSSVDLPRLEGLALTTLSGTLDSGSLESIVDACPNLKYLHLGPLHSSSDGFARVLQLPQLEELHLSIRTDSNRPDEALDAVNNISNVRILTLGGVTMNDEAIMAIVNKFPHLEHLSFSIQGTSVSAQGFDALRSMPQLKGVGITDVSIAQCCGIGFDKPFPKEWVKSIVRWQRQNGAK